MPDIFLSFESFLNPFMEILLSGLAYYGVLIPRVEPNVISSDVSSSRPWSLSRSGFICGIREQPGPLTFSPTLWRWPLFVVVLTLSYSNFVPRRGISTLYSNCL